MLLFLSTFDCPPVSVPMCPVFELLATYRAGELVCGLSVLDHFSRTFFLVDNKVPMFHDDVYITTGHPFSKARALI